MHRTLTRTCTKTVVTRLNMNFSGAACSGETPKTLRNSSLCMKLEKLLKQVKGKSEKLQGAFGYPSRKEDNEIALWEGDVVDQVLINVGMSQYVIVLGILPQTYKPHWQEAIEKIDASLVSDELILLVPILPCMLVDADLKEHHNVHGDTLKAALAQLQERGMGLNMLVDFLKIRENARQDKIE